jgi:tetratricopeptide (TPR) repeat protein
MFPYFNNRFLDQRVFSFLESFLENIGYIEIIQGYFKKQITHYENFISKSSDSKKKSDAWNTIGIIYTYFFNDSRYKGEKFTFESINSYDKSIELDPANLVPLINKGLAYLEMWEDIENNSSKSMECFEKAIEMFNKGNFNCYPHSYAEIWNDLGIVYYIQKRYNQSMECFEKAIEVEKQFEPAYNNLKIIYKKIYLENGNSNKK